MTCRIIKHLELVRTRRTDTKNAVPKELQIDGLPIDEEEEKDVVDDQSCRGGSSDEGSQGAGPHADADDGEGVDEQGRGAYPTVPSATCGRLPTGASPTDFLAEPFDLKKRTAEASYARGILENFHATGRDARRLSVAPTPLPRDSARANASAGCAAAVGERQESVFAKLDAFQIDEASAGISTKPHTEQRDGWAQQFQTAVAAMTQDFDHVPRSHTIVIEATVYLMRRGVLNAKDTQQLNIKQARALLNFAMWLQSYKSREWVMEGKLADPPWQMFEPKLLHVSDV